MKIFKNISLQKFNTFGIKVFAQELIIFEESKETQDYFQQNDLPQTRMIIGGGSNLLFTKDYSGSLYKMGNKGMDVIDQRSSHIWVKVAAGEDWDSVVSWAVENGYGGIENLSHIPGTIGAAAVQNIGAYGVEFQDVFQSLEAIQLSNGENTNFYLGEMSYEYRNSKFKTSLKNQFIITSVIIKLSRFPMLKLDYGQIKEEALKLSGKSLPDISDIRKAVIHIRQSKLPDPKEIGNAGSFFKNPIVDSKTFDVLQQKYPDIAYYKLEDSQYKLAAAWLIEYSGLKGIHKGKAGIHPQHALILTNNGNATGKEILHLSQFVQSQVKKDFNIELSPEVLIV